MGHGEYSQIRLKAETRQLRAADGRLLAGHGQFGRIYMLRHRAALALVEAGLAKLPRHMSIERLRELAAAAAT